MARAVAPFLFFTLLIVSNLPALADARRCDSWHALYGAALDEHGGRVAVEFVDGKGSEPHPLHITARDRSGKRLWRNTGHYWCYQGSGGCYAGLGYKDKKRTQDEAGNSLRLVFANARPGASDPDRASDILVIAGVNSAFFYGQTGGGLAIEFFAQEPDAVFVPEVFYFDRCKPKR